MSVLRSVIFERRRSVAELYSRSLTQIITQMDDFCAGAFVPREQLQRCIGRWNLTGELSISRLSDSDSRSGREGCPEFRRKGS
jgi:hypothetical protein